MKKHGDQKNKDWIQFLKRRISVLVAEGACKEKIESLKGTLKVLTK